MYIVSDAEVKNEEGSKHHPGGRARHKNAAALGQDLHFRQSTTNDGSKYPNNWPQHDDSTLLDQTY
jgi:hypothetical protein